MTLDLNRPSFHRSASEPSVVCATYVEKKNKGKATRMRWDEVNVCTEGACFSRFFPCILALINASLHRRSVSLVPYVG